MRRGSLLAVTLAAAGLLSAGTAAWGQPVLLPQGAPLPGELGYLLAGAYTAVANGPEAVWINPAGLADAPRSRLTVGGDALRWRRVGAAGSERDSLSGGVASLAYADAIGRAHDFPRFAFGVALADTAQARLSSGVNDAYTGRAADLPPGFPVGGSFDTDFPEGYGVRETGEASATLRVLTPSAGFAVAPTDWLRMGAGVHLERVSLALRAQGLKVYDGSAAGPNTITGHSHKAWSASGEALRLASTAGVQIDVAGRVLLAVVWRSPSRTLDGSGRLDYLRADRITIGIGGPGTTTQETAVVQRDGLPFRLEEPARLTVGLALRTDQVLVELDATRFGTLGPQTVLPATETEAPSSIALVLPPLRSTATGALGLALGVAYAPSGRTSLVMGIGSVPAGVAGDDGVYRALPVVTVSAGVYHVRGDLSGSLGLVHRRATAQGVRVAAPDGSVSPPRTVDVLDVSVQAGASLAF